MELFFCKKMKVRYDGIPEVSENPMMVVNKYGNVTAVYFAGSFVKTMSNFRFIEYFTIMKNICGCLSEQYVIVENSKNIEIFLRKKGNTVFLYLINMTSGIKRPLSFLQILHNVKLNINKIKPVKMQALKSGIILKYRKKIGLNLFYLNLMILK